MDEDVEQHAGFSAPNAPNQQIPTQQSQATPGTPGGQQVGVPIQFPATPTAQQGHPQPTPVRPAVAVPGQPGTPGAPPQRPVPPTTGPPPQRVAPQPPRPAPPSGPAPAGTPPGQPLVNEPVQIAAQPAQQPPGEQRPPVPHLADLLTYMVEVGASDLHISAGNPPLFRLHGDLIRTDHAKLMPNDIQEMIYAILTQKQREGFEEDLELDLSYSLPRVARFRVNVYRQRDAVGAAFRLIPFEIKTLQQLGIPNSVEQFSELPRGLVLVTGPTGSGKSTTLAALIDIVNSTKSAHIMSVEDPIEFLHNHKSSAVHQREVGSDTKSFTAALKHVLRQDPDVILVGEMRDLETIQMALTAAETGHLVFATLHTNSAPSSVDRIIDVFPPHQQQQIRIQLASSLMGVCTQTLIPTIDGRSRAVACEILVVTPAVSNLIREGKTHQIFSAMQAGGALGMQTMDKALADLVKTGKITRDEAEEKAHDKDNLAQLLRQG